MAGIGLAFAAIIVSVILEGGNLMAVFIPASMVLVIGGTIGVGVAGGILKDSTGNLVASIKVALLSKVTPADDMVEEIVKLAEQARREGLLALEDAARKVEDPFLRKGIELAIDGTDPEELREILEAEIQAKKGRDKVGGQILSDMGAYAPTIGIIGTVFSLVHVLENLDKPEELGHMIGGAFIATLWGVLTANVIFLPMGKKVARVSQLEAQKMELAVEGIMAIQAGSNPRIVGQKLRSFIGAEAPEAAKKAA